MQYYDKKNDRIIYIKSNATASYWDNIWNDEINWIEAYTKTVSLNNPFLRLFGKHLADGAKILEAGCGRGQFVFALKKKGFNCVGIDYAEKTVAALNLHLPELDIRLGDVTDLKNIKNESFDAYYSGGVIEHFWDGYSPIINEAKRVLKKGGKLFITFPFMSSARHKFKNELEEWNEDESPKDFYQFALNTSEVISAISETGFKLLHLKKRNGLKGFVETHSNAQFFANLYGYKGNSRFVRAFRYFLGISLAKLGYGHTIQLIFEKL